jgi:NAD(P)-dependent dehydrogenase (short-subunit alcohol dehydrogenase family)
MKKNNKMFYYKFNLLYESVPWFGSRACKKKNFINPQGEQAILNHTPMKRFGEPHELIGAAIWLASDSSKFVTGAEITVDGGFSCMTI